MIQDDGRPDPRFAATAEELTRSAASRIISSITRCRRSRASAGPGPPARAAGQPLRPGTAATPMAAPVLKRASLALGLAKALSLLVPAALLAGAYGSEYIGGLLSLRDVLVAALGAYGGARLRAGRLRCAGRLPDRGRSFVWLAALAILISGADRRLSCRGRGRHFEGFTQCTAVDVGGSAEDLLERIMAAPLVRCDEVQWSLLGISMAGWNAILSLGSALVILWLSLKRPRTAI